jgi:PAS domain S-box-containing protein
MASLRHDFEEPGDLRDIRLVVDTIPTLAWSAGPDGSAEFLNQRWLDYTGLTAKQALDSGWQVAIHPGDLPRILETYREALNSVNPFEVEGRFRRFDGEFRWFLFRGSPLRDRSGKVAKWYGTNTDLEERKRAEDALRASETFARSPTPNPQLQLETRDFIRKGDSLPGRASNVRDCTRR